MLESARGLLAWQFTTWKVETASSGRPGPVLEEPWCQGPGKPLSTWLEGEWSHINSGRGGPQCLQLKKEVIDPTPPVLCDPKQVSLPLWASPSDLPASPQPYDCLG